MSKQEIETFSLDTVTQEEKDFLVYMYGNDLEKIVTKNPKELTWWMKAFQAVQSGKRPKFNWSAAFLTPLWALRKKNFKFIIYVTSVAMILTCLLSVLIKAVSSSESLVLAFVLAATSLVYYFGIILAYGMLGPKHLIQDYLKSGHVYQKGRLPFKYIISALLIHVLLEFIFNTNEKYAQGQFLIMLIPLLMTVVYSFILMKFWLPAKKISEA